MQVQEVIKSAPQEIDSRVTLREAAYKMVRANGHSLAVVSRGSLVGIFTESDLTAAVADGASPAEDSVQDWMTPAPDTVDSDMNIASALQWMVEGRYRHLPIVKDGNLIGVLSMRDLVDAVMGQS